MQVKIAVIYVLLDNFGIKRNACCFAHHHNSQIHGAIPASIYNTPATHLAQGVKVLDPIIAHPAQTVHIWSRALVWPALQTAQAALIPMVRFNAQAALLELRTTLQQ